MKLNFITALKYFDTEIRKDCDLSNLQILQKHNKALLYGIFTLVAFGAS